MVRFEVKIIYNFAKHFLYSVCIGIARHVRTDDDEEMFQ